MKEKKTKQRLDQLVFSRGLTESRERAKTTIMSGQVFVNGQRMDKPGMLVLDDSRIEIQGETKKFVSRGGYKLEKALDTFSILPQDRICIDCGASTGGFTDCLLKRGAQKVYAIDVGYGQLSWALRSDSRVVVMERTNIRHVTPDQFPDAITLAVMDLSFISLHLVLPAVSSVLTEHAEIICLVKPQFEAGREKVGKKGVVRDPAVHLEVLQRFCLFVKEAGLGLKNMSYSPIKGPEGNIEYLAHLQKGTGETQDILLEELVEASHATLSGI